MSRGYRPGLTTFILITWAWSVYQIATSSPSWFAYGAPWRSRYCGRSELSIARKSCVLTGPGGAFHRRQSSARRRSEFGYRSRLVSSSVALHVFGHGVDLAWPQRSLDMVSAWPQHGSSIGPAYQQNTRSLFTVGRLCSWLLSTSQSSTHLFWVDVRWLGRE